MEVQNCLRDFYESLYDPTYLVELVVAAEYQLWDDAKHKMPEKVGLSALHTMDYEKSVKHWEEYFYQFRRTCTWLVCFLERVSCFFVNCAAVHFE